MFEKTDAATAKSAEKDETEKDEEQPTSETSASGVPPTDTPAPGKKSKAGDKPRRLRRKIDKVTDLKEKLAAAQKELREAERKEEEKLRQQRRREAASAGDLLFQLGLSLEDIQKMFEVYHKKDAPAQEVRSKLNIA